MATKKINIIKTATRLFASQGFEATTTLQLAREAGVTEPLIYYHFKGKDELFTHILSAAFEEFYARLDALKKKTGTEFEQIANLIDFHYRIIEEMPNELYLAFSICPARLKDPDSICAKNSEKFRKNLSTYLSGCLRRGIKKGEFHKVPVKETASLLMATFRGLMRQRIMGMENLKGLKKATVEFCRRSLVAG